MGMKSIWSLLSVSLPVDLRVPVLVPALCSQMTSTLALTWVSPLWWPFLYRDLILTGKGSSHCMNYSLNPFQNNQAFSFHAVKPQNAVLLSEVTRWSYIISMVRSRPLLRTHLGWERCWMPCSGGFRYTKKCILGKKSHLPLDWSSLDQKQYGDYVLCPLIIVLEKPPHPQIHFLGLQYILPPYVFFWAFWFIG